MVKETFHNMVPADVSLVIEIQNKQPVELIDLTKSLISLANQFNSYSNTSSDEITNREGRLYVRKIETGSVILELIEYATIGILPFMENVNTITGFASFLKHSYDFVLGKTTEKPKELSVTDYNDLSAIVNPVAKDNGSQINISTKVDGDINVFLDLSSLEANAAQNVIGQYVKQLKAPEEISGVKTNVLLTFYQTRSDSKAKKGNRGIIEEIQPGPANIIFEPESLNEEMLHGDFNPNDTVYVVDALPQTVGGKIAAYKIIKLHETFEKPSAE